MDNLESFMDTYWNEVDALRRQLEDTRTFGDQKQEEANKEKDEMMGSITAAPPGASSSSRACSPPTLCVGCCP